MRIRRRKWAKKELEEAKFYIDDPTIYKGKWKEKFNNENNKIYLELGCGKGTFIATLASNHPEINFIACDMIEAMLGLSKRNIEEKYLDKNLEINNLYLIRMNAERILDVFSDEDKIDRIYINFCNPWPRGKHQKRRLTHTRLLLKYKQFLKDGVDIYFKTDDEDLYNSSFRYFNEADYKIIKYTDDLHSNNIFAENFTTEHEEMYTKEGIKIKAIIARV